METSSIIADLQVAPPCPLGHGLTLDVRHGFSSPIYVNLYNQALHSVRFRVPYASYLDTKWNINLCEALQLRLLALTDEASNEIRFNLQESETCRDRRRRCHLPGAFNIRLPLRSVSNSLSSRFERLLVPGQTYGLRFATDHFPLSCILDRRNQTHIAGSLRSEELDEVLMDMKCKSGTIFFTVVAQITVPRFTAELILSSSILCARHPEKFCITVTITSLGDQPVTVYPNYDRAKSNDFSGSRLSWTIGKVYPDEIFDLDNEFRWEAGRGRLLLNKRLPLEPICDQDDQNLVQFSKNSTMAYTTSLECKEPLLLGTSIPLSLTLQDGGIHTWKDCNANEYGDAREDFHLYCGNNRPPVVFEKVSAVALTLKTIFEREGPQPFIRLPYELRERVYDLLRFCEGAGTVHFTLTDGQGCCRSLYRIEETSEITP